MNISDIVTIAENLARNCGYSVFPCRHNKRPACPHGFLDAVSDPVEVRPLWRRYPGPLIGVACGDASGISVLDVDIKADDARAWWFQNQHRSARDPNLSHPRRRPPRRVPAHTRRPQRPGRTHPRHRCPWRRRLCHLVVRRTATSASTIQLPRRGPRGCRSSSGHHPSRSYIAIHTALPSRSPTATWNASNDRAIDRVRSAADGQRHYRLRASARLLGGIQHRAGFSDTDAVEWLLNAVPGQNTNPNADARTVQWGLESGRATPLEARP